MRTGNPIKRRKQRDIAKDRVLYAFNYLFLLLIFIIVGYPLLIVVSNSLSSPEAVTGGKVWLLPVDFSLEGYQAVFQDKSIVSGFRNSFFYMIVGTAINMVVTTLCAYPLSIKTLPGRRWFMLLFSFTMFFSGGMIPTYLLIYKLGMINTVWSMILPGAISVWNMILMRTYFMNSVPGDIREAAIIDGCSDFRYLVKILIPLSVPIMAVLVLYYAVGHWNSYFNALLYLRDTDLYPLQMVLRNILIMNNASMDMLASDPEAMSLRIKMIDLVKYSVIVVASLPLVILYPFIQKYFVQGIMVGSLKG
ncbi:carbohydrate ABC transporter permease [Bianquea renquensis]|jgi:ABC transporter, permease protein|uniref:Carbohydrate ABC transporter permease n=1 Tax=Bianquea renquensis TaxID=2763661 RepID=A0A926DV16_9FIRM|nr:carbohydrate ABC transporter permease [Bianquea renquensis]MBC8544222.1 carbohydrate ABC transporter permease [Bianquea renquensis]